MSAPGFVVFRSALRVGGALAIMMTCACGPAESPRTEQAAAAHVSRTASARDVVARVDGTPILRADLLRQARQTQSEVREALQQLVEEELLVQEALRRGLENTPAVRQLYRRVLANRLLVTRYAEQYTKADIPAQMIEQAYKVHHMRFDRPDLVKVSHIIVHLGKAATAKQVREARRIATQIWRQARGKTLSPEEFRALAEPLRDTYPAFEIRAESLATPRHGRVVESFGAAAFALSEVGDISRVVQTRYGFHVIYLEDRRAARHLSLEQASSEIRDNIFDVARNQAVKEYLVQLERATSVKRFPQALVLGRMAH